MSSSLRGPRLISGSMIFTSGKWQWERLWLSLQDAKESEHVMVGREGIISQINFSLNKSKAQRIHKLSDAMQCDADMLTELSRREKEANIKPDPDIDVYMKVTNLL